MTTTETTLPDSGKPEGVSHRPEPWRMYQTDAGWGVEGVTRCVVIYYDGPGGEHPTAIPALWEPDARLIAAAPDLKAALLTADCPGGGWTGQPDSIVQATVADCLAYGVCGCTLGDAVKKAEGRQ